MELSDFENGIESHLNQISLDIKANGYFVAIDEEYAFTVGRNIMGEPELVIDRRAMNDDSARKIIDRVAQSQNTANKVKVCRPMEDSEIRSKLYSARLYYGHWNIKAIELMGAAI